MFGTDILKSTTEVLGKITVTSMFPISWCFTIILLNKLSVREYPSALLVLFPLFHLHPFGPPE